MTSIPWEVSLFGPTPHNFDAYHYPSNGQYVSPGNAFSASCVTILEGLTAHVNYARVVVIWNPQHPSCGVKINTFDSGNVNSQAIAEFTDESRPLPIVSAADITLPLRAIFQAGQRKFIGWQVKDSGTGLAPYIYQIRIEAVLEI